MDTAVQYSVSMNSAGPWTVHQTRTHFHVRSATHEVALVRRIGPESEFDASLIAQAPELLALVEECIAQGPLAGSPLATKARACVNRARMLP